MQDREQFEARTKGLVEQFSKFEALPGLFVNGELTLGENIGDLGGTSIALKAYRMSLKGQPSPVIDGFSGEQRFFLGNAQSSRIKWRDQILEIIVKPIPTPLMSIVSMACFPICLTSIAPMMCKPGDELIPA